jgi:formate hydrogenlyase subunit 4
MNPLAYGILFVVAAPLFGGLLAGVDRIVSARMQGRVGPPLLQPFYDVGKLFEKEARRINPVVEPLLLGHVGFMAAAGALSSLPARSTRRTALPGLNGSWWSCWPRSRSSSSCSPPSAR